MKNHRILLGLSAFLLLSVSFLSFSTSTYAGYTDSSKYNVETQEIIGDSKVSKTIKDLKTEFGWSSKYEKTGSIQNYQIYSGGFGSQAYIRQILSDFEKITGINGSYEPVQINKPHKIYSGGFGSESKAKQVASDFQKSTGIKASISAIGDEVPYYQIYSGGFGAASTAKEVANNFQKSTGIKASYEPNDHAVLRYQIYSGGFSTLSRVKEVAEDFQKATGLKATYEPLGPSVESYRIKSGGFKGVERVKTVIHQLKEETGVTASYEKIPNSDSLRVYMDGLSKAQLIKVREFFTSQKWYFSTQTNHEYSSYRVVANPVQTKKAAQGGLEFFSKNGWWASYKATYSSYRVVAEPVLGSSQAKKGLEFFSKNKWWATYKATGNFESSSYRVVSEPITGSEKAKQGLEFFTKNNWYAVFQSNSSDTYRIVTDSVDLTKAKEGLAYFKQNKWWANYYKSGAAQDIYKIIIGKFTGVDNANAAVRKLKDTYGWNAKAIKLSNVSQIMYTEYDLTLNEMLDNQMAQKPQTDKYRNEIRYVHADYVDIEKQVITAKNVNVRSKPAIVSTNIVQRLNTGDKVLVVGVQGDWVKVKITWQNAQPSDVMDYLDPSNFSADSKGYFQFLKLSQPTSISASELNEKVLKNKGILAGKGKAFVDAANKYNINEIYLISHALLETGNGSSNLANGVKVNGKTVYNMYGYGAYDSCPLTCGAERAYELGWFTPEASIIGGAQFISGGYIYNDTFQQDTLYKMRWNPVQTWHQYASDIGWAYKQVDSIYNLYQLLDNRSTYFDIPRYKK